MALLLAVAGLLLVATLPAQDQDAAEGQAEDTIPLSLDLNRRVPGGSGTLAVTIPVPRQVAPEDVLSALVLRLPETGERLDFFPGREERRISRAPGGTNQSAIRIEVPMVLRSAGRVLIPPVIVDAPWAQLETEERLLEIPFSAADSRTPFDAAWRTPRREIYVGESVPLYLELSNIPDFVLPEDIEVATPSGALMEEVRGLGSVESRVVDGETLYRYSAASYMYTATLEGELQLPAGVVTAQGIERRAETQTLSVQPLPEAVAGTGAIGDFRVTATLEPMEIPVGESAELTVQVEGTGNILFLQFPEIVTEGMVITEAGSSSEVTPTEQGYRGSRRIRYRVTPRESGIRELTVDAFPHLAPESGDVSREPAQTFVLNSLAAPGDGGSGGGEEGALRLLDLEEIRRLQPAELFRRPWMYVIAGVPLLLVPALLILRRRIPRLGALLGGILLLFVSASLPLPEGLLEEGAAAFAAGEYPAAREAYMQALDERPENPGIHYNLALTAARAGRTGEAVFHLRESVRLAPQFDPGWDALNTVERRAGLERQVEPLRFVHPDVLLIALIVLIYLAAVLLLLLLRTRRGTVAILFALALGGILLVGGAFGYSLYTRGKNVAVVSVTQAPLSRIPDEGAQTWLSLPAGSAVTPVARYRDFVLVRTGYGVEGWTRVPDLIVRDLPEGPS